MSITNFRIFINNYADVDILPYYTASSEQSAFPVANAFNYQRRSKVWRSNGYFTVTSANRILHFRDYDDGDDLYASLNIGIYTSGTDFCTEIARAMNAAGGDATYSVAITANRIELTTSAPAEGMYTYFSTSTCASLIGMTQNHGTLNQWIEPMDEIRITSEEFILIDMGVATTFDACILMDQKTKSIQIPPTGVVKLEGNETSNFSSPSFSVTIPYNEICLSYITDAGVSTTAYRYWRVHFNDDCAMPNGYVQLGALLMGDYWSPTRARAQFPLKQAYQDMSTTMISEGGQSFSDIKEITSTFDVEILGLYKEDVEEFDDFFSRVKTAKPFFISMDTAEVFSSDMNRRIMLCKFEREPVWTLESPNNFTLTFSLREEL